MERIITAIETIEANSARMFGLEDERTQIVFMLTDSLRTLFENEEAVASVPEAKCGVMCFDDLLEIEDEEEVNKIIANLSDEQIDAFAREGMFKLLDKIFE